MGYLRLYCVILLISSALALTHGTTNSQLSISTKYTNSSCDFCITCNEKNLCELCIEGYYLQPLEDSPTEGNCLPCKQGCASCDNGEECTDCLEGFTIGDPDCPPCHKGCTSCSEETTYCTSCQDNYYLSDHTCFFQYTVHIILASVLLLFLCIIGIRYLCECIKRRKEKANMFVGTVLDEESRKNTFYVSHKIKIGKTVEDKDISNVESKQMQGDEFISNKTVDMVLSEKDTKPTAGYRRVKG